MQFIKNLKKFTVRSLISAQLGTRTAMQCGVTKARSTTANSAKANTRTVRIGYIALTDAAPLLTADALGLFTKHGVEVELSREVGWATIREKIIYGQLDAAHAVAGLALSMRLGLDGMSCKTIAPFVFNLHGNGITLGMDLWSRGVRDAATLHKLIRSTPQRLFTFGIVSRVSSHNFMLRRWLQLGGIDPDHDVRLVVLPPTQMVGSLSAGLIDGYCVGEPWNSAAIAHRVGWCPAVSEDLMPGHPEKILLSTDEFATERPEALSALIRALYEACAFCDKMENRMRVVEIVHSCGGLRVDRDALIRSLVGPFDDGTSRRHQPEDFHIFHRRNANEPSREKSAWLHREFVTHGLIPSAQAESSLAVLRECWRSDLFHQALESNPTKKPRTPRPRQLATA